MPYGMFEAFLAWEEVAAQKMIEATPGHYYTEIENIPANTFRAVYLPDRWRLDISTIRAEIESGKIPVVPGWRSMGKTMSGRNRLCRMLFVPNDFLAAKEKKFPQLQRNAEDWATLCARLDSYRNHCSEASAFYDRLPPSLSPEMNLPRSSSCPLVRKARLEARQHGENTPHIKLKVVPDSQRWKASVAAGCRAVAQVVEKGGRWHKRTAAKDGFLDLMGALYSGEGVPLGEAEEAAWTALPEEYKKGAGAPSAKKQKTIKTIDCLK